MESAGRIEVEESDIEEFLADAPEGYREEWILPDQPPAGELEVLGSPSNSEFDLSLFLEDSKGKPAESERGNPDSPVASVGSDDFGVRLYEDSLTEGRPTKEIPSVQEVADTNPGIQPSVPRPQRAPSPADSSVNVLSSLSLPVTSEPATDYPARVDTPPTAPEPGSGNSGKSAASQDYRAIGSVHQHAGNSLAPAAVSIEEFPIQSAVRLSSGQERGSKGVLLGALLGTMLGFGLCLLIWPGFLSKGAGTAQRAGDSAELLNPNAAVEPSSSDLGSTESSDRRLRSVETDVVLQQAGRRIEHAIDMARGFDLAGAVRSIQQTREQLDNRRAQEPLTSGMADRAVFENSLRRICDVLETAWHAETALIRSGHLSPERKEPSTAVNSLLAERDRLKANLTEVQSQVDAVRVALGQLKTTAEDRQLKLAQAAAAADKSARTVAGLTEELAGLQKRLRAAESRLQAAEASRKQADETAARKPAATDTNKKASVLPPPPPDLSAHEYYVRGRAAYAAARYAEAERDLQTAVRADNQDARYHYLLGLARWAAGKENLARQDFGSGARLERANKPSHVFIELALEAAEPGGLKVLNEVRAGNPELSKK